MIEQTVAELSVSVCRLEQEALKRGDLSLIVEDLRARVQALEADKDMGAKCPPGDEPAAPQGSVRKRLEELRGDIGKSGALLRGGKYGSNSLLLDIADSYDAFGRRIDSILSSWPDAKKLAAIIGSRQDCAQGEKHDRIDAIERVLEEAL